MLHGLYPRTSEMLFSIRHITRTICTLTVSYSYFLLDNTTVLIWLPSRSQIFVPYLYTWLGILHWPHLIGTGHAVRLNQKTYCCRKYKKPWENSGCKLNLPPIHNKWQLFMPKTRQSPTYPRFSWDIRDIQHDHNRSQILSGHNQTRPCTQPFPVMTIAGPEQETEFENSSCVHIAYGRSLSMYLNTSIRMDNFCFQIYSHFISKCIWVWVGSDQLRNVFYVKYLVGVGIYFTRHTLSIDKSPVLPLRSVTMFTQTMCIRTNTSKSGDAEMW